MSTEGARAASSRLHSLDGLRGVAALIVVFHHSLLTIPVLAAPYFESQASEGMALWPWLMTYTPLHLFWEGKGAVYLFFVLSGIVLTLPVLRAEHFAWRAYFPQRLLRLYLPVWGAVLFTVIMILAVPRVGSGVSEWLAKRPSEVTAHAVLRDTTLVSGAGSLASPLWSLQWEVLFSLALPLFVLIAVKFPKLLAVKVALTFALIAIAGGLGNQEVFYMTMFLVGSLFATLLERLREFGSRIDRLRHPRFAWWGVLTAGLLLVYSHWLITLFAPPGWLLGGSRVLMVMGAVLIIFVAACWAGARRALEVKPLRWLGLVSFTLYLVHEPIVIASSFLFGPSLAWVSIPIGIVASLLFTALFYRIVEHPSHLLAQSVKRRLSNSSGRDPRPAPKLATSAAR